MKPLFVSLLSDEATDAARFGPKAANLAALCQATYPWGFLPGCTGLSSSIG